MRIVSATHKDLAAEVQAGRFRQDLYYRLNVIQILVPPLRERREDLPAHLRSACSSASRAMPACRRRGCRRDALRTCARYPLPGNVRELENLLHRAVALSGGEELDVSTSDLPESVFTDSAGAGARPAAHRGERRRGGGARAQPAGRGAAAQATWQRYLDEVERDILVRALEHQRFNRTAAGASLGLSLRQMRYRMARLNVNVGGDLTGTERE